MIPEWITQGLDPIVVAFDICGDWDINVPVVGVPQFKSNLLFRHVTPLAKIFQAKYYESLCTICEKIIRANDINIVFSFSNPQASNRLGAMLKDRMGVAFVSHFSDPDYNNPYKKFSKANAKKILAREKFIIEQSNFVVFVNDVLKDFVMHKYPQSFLKKARVVPHCYDRKLYPSPVATVDTERTTLSHIGAFYTIRTPDFLFAALAALKEKDPLMSKRIRLELIGAVSDYSGYSQDALTALIDKYGLEEIVAVLPFVSYEKSLENMVNADCLVVIDSNISLSPFLPSKLIDYVGSGKNIIGITPQNSPTWNLLKRLNANAFSYDQPAELTEYLSRLVYGKEPITLNADCAAEFDVSNTTRTLIDVFHQAVPK